LQASNKSERDPVEPQASLRGAAPLSYTLLDSRDLDGNPLLGNRDISIGRVFTLFPRRREMPGKGLDSGLLLLPQFALAPPAYAERARREAPRAFCAEMRRLHEQVVEAALAGGKPRGFR
jgi:hypothetical protein